MTPMREPANGTARRLPSGANAAAGYRRGRTPSGGSEAARARVAPDAHAPAPAPAPCEALAVGGHRPAAAEDLPPLPGTDPEPRSLESSALQNRLDLQAARKAVEARLDAAGVQARWRWLGAAELGVFRESASGGTRFTGPNAMVELPLFDQRQAQILSTNAEGRAARRRLEAQMLVARGEIRTHAAELAATRALLRQYEADLLPAYRRLRDEQGATTAEGRRAQLALLDAEEQHSGLLRDYWRARGALARAAGAWEAMPEWPTITQSGATAP